MGENKRQRQQYDLYPFSRQRQNLPGTVKVIYILYRKLFSLRTVRH